MKRVAILFHGHLRSYCTTARTFRENVVHKIMIFNSWKNRKTNSRKHRENNVHETVFSSKIGLV